MEAWPRGKYQVLGKPVIRDTLLPAGRHIVSCFNTDEPEPSTTQQLAAHHQPLRAFIDPSFQQLNIL